MHSTLISIPKLADEGYTTVLSGKTAEIYDDTTTTVTANKPSVLSAPRCNTSGLWTLSLATNYSNCDHTTESQRTTNEQASAVFDLPSTRQTFLWYHAAAGFPTKETFLRAVHKGNYATWPKLTMHMIHNHFPDSDKTSKVIPKDSDKAYGPQNPSNSQQPKGTTTNQQP